MQTVATLLTELVRRGVKLSAQDGRLHCFARHGQLTPELRDGMFAHKAELLALLISRKQPKSPPPGPVAADGATEFPLSVGQKGLYILQKRNPAITAYNVPVCFSLDWGTHPETLGRAWNYILEQFPILTARIVERDDGLHHRIDDACWTKLQCQTISLTGDRELASFLRRQANEPFDLTRGPLVRIQLFTRDAQRPILLLTIHHIIFDGTSAVILLKSFLRIYQELRASKSPRVPKAVNGYREFVAWEQAMLASAEGAAHGRYWQNQLAGELAPLGLLPDAGPEDERGGDGNTLVEDLPDELGGWIRAYTSRHNLSPSVFFLAALQLLLHRYTGQNDVIAAMPVMGRVGQRFADEVGYFINMVPLRTRFEDGMTIETLLRRVQATMLDGLYHSSYPFPFRLKRRRAEVVYIDKDHLHLTGACTPEAQQSMNRDLTNY